MRIVWCFLLLASHLQAIPQYYCTAADSGYFKPLMGLIGSIHESNFDDLGEIAVFDIGLKKEEISQLENIQKVRVYRVDTDNPDVLHFFYPPNARKTLGWYSWKPMVVKQSLDLFPYVLWIDAAATVLRPLNNLFESIVKNRYFLVTIGDERKADGSPVHSVDWQTNGFLREKFQLEKEENRWILSQDCVTSCIVGASREAWDDFVGDWFEATKDLRNFIDDGIPYGYGCARHDQAVLTLIAYTKKLTIFDQDFTQKNPIALGEDLFYITWHHLFVDAKTSVYSSRQDLRAVPYFSSRIRLNSF
ncbi:MAG: hypothetical protein A3E80_01275 [Chlamydiae bacterium RIFCSPHIGHO2_12_FULL_49_9]|nr:MAG: hypothetical protein A3E80_01275 [Chlamydiae bacterium RIFCSPHIGHO2_12_FULL_49_9]